MRSGITTDILREPRMQGTAPEVEAVSAGYSFRPARVVNNAPLSVIIPAYNEERTILQALEGVLAIPCVGQVIVVNDGSSDGTAVRLSTVRDSRVAVLHHATRAGKGAAIRSGLGRVSGELVVIQDADMEYSASELPALAAVILSGEAVVVYGSRFRGGITGMAFANRVANRLLTLLTNCLYGSHLSDEATCYKMFRSEVLQSLPLQCVGFEFCPEVTALVLRRGLAIAEVPISYRGRCNAAGKKIRWWHFVTAVRTLVRYRFASVGDRSIARPALAPNAAGRPRPWEET